MNCACRFSFILPHFFQSPQLHKNPNYNNQIQNTRKMSSIDLILKPACEGCGSPSDLYGSNCKHKTLCSSCGKRMAENRNRCSVCGTPVTKLIREYNVRSSASTDKSCFIGRFVTGLPPFSKKKNTENKWTLHKDGLLGRQLTDALRDKYKNKPWLLEDETGQHQFQGQLEGAQSATYYLLVLQGKEFTAVPASSWYNFNKVAQYKQLTTEEAEEIMSKRKSSASGYERWMMKAANSGPAAFGEVKEEKAAAGPRSKKLKSKDDGRKSDNDEEDGEMEVKRKFGSGLNRKGVDEDDEDEKGGDKDFDDDIEIGDDWEHEEIFTDDDEAVENDPLEREDLLAPEMPAPPEIKQDDEDEVEDEEGGLSTSGKELKKLLGKAAGLDESDAEEEDDDDDVEDENASSPFLAPKQKVGVKDEPVDNSPSKTTPAGSSRGPPSSSKSKSKKKSTIEDAKISNSAVIKKEVKLSVIEEASSSVARSSSSAVPNTGPTASERPVTEEEIRTTLLAKAPITTQELVGNFKGRIKTHEDKKAFAEKLKKIGKIQKMNGNSYVVLREMR